ncbi:MAG: alpha/beta hydrolase [Chloroflexi bacterium]|nr:alpha/beta hydrolase [Chloroflexota bacterium]
MWRHYLEGKDPTVHSISGDVLVQKQVYSPQLHNRRDVFVYLPPSYGRSHQHYPVIYMHDGQNLFDHALSFAGEWEVDETMEALAEEGLEAIVVGLANLDKQRIHEYAPFDTQRFGKARGDAYGAFILETVKPMIDRDFRTLPDAAHTGIFGSSLGGLISLYLFFQYRQHFGLAGVMSPSLWFGSGVIVPYVVEAPYVPGKIYLDVGLGERLGWMERIKTDTATGMHSASVRSMRDILMTKGYRLDHNLLYIEDEEGIHNEASWARRLPRALRFLLRR